jgi:hypothetical protein
MSDVMKKMGKLGPGKLPFGLSGVNPQMLAGLGGGLPPGMGRK